VAGGRWCVLKRRSLRGGNAQRWLRPLRVVGEEGGYEVAAGSRRSWSACCEQEAGEGEGRVQAPQHGRHAASVRMEALRGACGAACARTASL